MLSVLIWIVSRHCPYIRPSHANNRIFVTADSERIWKEAVSGRSEKDHKSLSHYSWCLCHLSTQ